MKCRRINLRGTLCGWIAVMSIVAVLSVVLLISALIDGKFDVWLLAQVLAIPFLGFMFWLGTRTLKIIEFYPDKLIFKTILGKIIEVVPVTNILSVHIEIEDMGVFGFFPRYYIFDVVGDEKYFKRIAYPYNQGDTKRIATPFMMECNAKNEKLLKEFLPILIPDSAPPSSSHMHHKN